MPSLNNGGDGLKSELTKEEIARMIDIALWKAETRILKKVVKVILANNQKVLEQLTELGVINQE
ncbi:hypothetical protein [Candidatus Magnetobacterium casense]|uniref:Uncharacterized protein n=1 Tax=Candidatus Magnetobacterium casense TaxID=1455061 RepID=A0ABS6RXZ5_9BACT|nr:hypothetical protein [Candidatus Magnetobacterium casensis]MBV6341481.1 hypothetical protein [Candidatus Magnetobacterium casensis]